MLKGQYEDVVQDGKDIKIQLEEQLQISCKYENRIKQYENEFDKYFTESMHDLWQGFDKKKEFGNAEITK